MKDEIEKLKPGTYVLAVSGGVDSMVLLDVLNKQAGVRLVVAHYDHGIRKDSGVDARLVARIAKQHGIVFELGRGHLGVRASEEVARIKRYEFLNSIVNRYKAAALITAHHQDDVLETALLNTLRGTGRKGLTSLTSTKKLIRPLLGIDKVSIREYAKQHGLEWREDSTNTDAKYRRNYVRKHLLSDLSQQSRAQLISALTQQSILNKNLDTLLGEIVREPSLKRSLLVQLLHSERCEVLASWLRTHGLRAFDRPMIEQLSILSVTLALNKRADIYGGSYMMSGDRELTLHVKR